MIQLEETQELLTWKISFQAERKYYRKSLIRDYASWLEKNYKKSYHLRAAASFHEWYLAYTQKEKLDPNTIKPVDLEYWIDYLFNDARYIKKRSQAPQMYNVNSIRAYKRSIKTFFRYLLDTKQISESAYQAIHKRSARSIMQPEMLSQRQTALLTSYYDTHLRSDWHFIRNKAILYASLYGGLSLTDIIQLPSNSLKVLNAVIKIEMGDKPRIVEIEAELMNPLLDWIEIRGGNIEKMFVTDQYKPLTESDMAAIYQVCGVDVGIPNLSAIVLRNTYIKNLYEKGYEIPFIAYATGASPHYIHRIAESIDF
ncbi:tyrosine-type recombinase/integrase [Paenibacillus campinasensis]|uniref:Tyr recombinase domain-containing protein n=1 Tax=Paenibacillus campinasensis TaxID=66347 RepID=A0A268EIV6_9BACL|nr:tyrosine-type recombinase/integrase [Paenibacillus campinasensis]PAD73068.1 hypothetical protein CHH67_21045 [Paenibacillus campinasensis]